MGRIFLVVVLVLLVLSAAGLLLLGAFPPDAPVQQIHKVLPNERFQRTN
jgi:hypothetical protein